MLPGCSLKRLSGLCSGAVSPGSAKKTLISARIGARGCFAADRVHRQVRSGGI